MAKIMLIINDIILVNEKYNGLMFVINDIRIVEDDELIENPIIRMSVTLSHQTLMVNDAYQNNGSIIFDPVLQFSIYKKS